MDVVGIEFGGEIVGELYVCCFGDGVGVKDCGVVEVVDWWDDDDGVVFVFDYFGSDYLVELVVWLDVYSYDFFEGGVWDFEVGVVVGIDCCV